MRKQILPIIALLMSLLANSQDTAILIDTVYPPNPRLIDDSPLGMGITIGDNQSYLKGKDQDLLISQPTVIDIKKIQDVFYIKAYVNNDHFNIIAPWIKKDNSKNYRAFQQVTFSDAIPQPNTKRANEIPFDIRKDFTILATSNLNDDKVDGRNFLFFIEDVKTGQIVSQLALEYVYPRPEPQLLTIDQKVIDYYESRPGETIYFNPETISIFKKQVKEANLVTSEFSPNTNLPKQLVLPNQYNSLLLRFKTLRLGAVNYLEYKFADDSTWKTSAKNEQPFIILHDLRAGKHKLQVRYPRQGNNVFMYEFEVKPHWSHTTTFKMLLGSVFIISLFSSLFIIKYSQQKRVLRAENAKRKQAEAQISSLRAQLNPHFVFNALNSIQGLVNKNDQEGANVYISKFGSLMRDILEQGDKTTHALALEIKQLESYLQLEQLRFQFKYLIEKDTSINFVETDFPVMLIQPFAENAIKHGISGKRENGCIQIRFEKNEEDLNVIIQDNGGGFNPSELSAGYGIRLIKERIEALNQFNKDQPIKYEIQSTPISGTIVTLTFTKWLIKEELV